jgi:hypothetical protein
MARGGGGRRAKGGKQTREMRLAHSPFRGRILHIDAFLDSQRVTVDLRQ